MPTAKEVFEQQFMTEGWSNSDAAISEWLRLFSHTANAVDPTMKFNVGNIIQWCLAYQRAGAKDLPPLPDTLKNAYSLGRWLSKNCVVVGLAKVGTYGNKQIFMVEIKED